MIALVIVADGDQTRLMDTLADLMENAPMGDLSPKIIVDASGDPHFRRWMEARVGLVFDQIVDIEDYPIRPVQLELRIPAGVHLDGLELSFR